MTASTYFLLTDDFLRCPDCFDAYPIGGQNCDDRTDLRHYLEGHPDDNVRLLLPLLYSSFFYFDKSHYEQSIDYLRSYFQFELEDRLIDDIDSYTFAAHESSEYFDVYVLAQADLTAILEKLASVIDQIQGIYSCLEPLLLSVPNDSCTRLNDAQIERRAPRGLVISKQEPGEDHTEAVSLSGLCTSALDTIPGPLRGNFLPDSIQIKRRFNEAYTKSEKKLLATSAAILLIASYFALSSYAIDKSIEEKTIRSREIYAEKFGESYRFSDVENLMTRQLSIAKGAKHYRFDILFSSLAAAIESTQSDAITFKSIRYSMSNGMVVQAQFGKIDDYNLLLSNLDAIETLSARTKNIQSESNKTVLATLSVE